MFGYEETSPRDRYEAIQDHLDAMYGDLTEEIESRDRQIEKLEDRVDDVLAEKVLLSVKLAEQTEATDKAYTQRAIVAIAFANTVLANGGSAGVGTDDREDQPSNWRVVLYVDTPAGQLSWHIAPSDQYMLDGLPQYTKPWDGTFNSSNTDFYKEFTKCRAT